VRGLFSPSVRGRAAEGGRGSLTHHLELELANTPEGRAAAETAQYRSWFHVSFNELFGDFKFNQPSSC
jgi:hypothetical protein